MVIDQLSCSDFETYNFMAFKIIYCGQFKLLLVGGKHNTWIHEWIIEIPWWIWIGALLKFHAKTLYFLMQEIFNQPLEVDALRESSVVFSTAIFDESATFDASAIFDASRMAAAPEWINIFSENLSNFYVRHCSN